METSWKPMYKPHGNLSKTSQTAVQTSIRAKQCQNSAKQCSNASVFHTPRFSYTAVKTVICACPSDTVTVVYPCCRDAWCPWGVPGRVYWVGTWEGIPGG